MEEASHRVDFCVVGGGLAGLCAAVAAARRGCKTALVHERPVLGGNASSEIRMWICGAHGKNMRETGLVEELELENFFRNPHGVWPLWDTVLYGLARNEPNLLLLLNCSANGIKMEGDTIVSIRGWQMTTQTWHTVEAKLFADCSGDSILAALSGAETRWGRESSAEFGEDIAPPQTDRCNMGMSILLQARETPRPQPFTPPSWAKVFADDSALPHRWHGVRNNNWWWIELGGEQDTIRDTEKIRDELLAAALGVWDHVKNRGEHGAANWILDWIGFLPGKRESRRYVGDHILTQSDVRSSGKFDDIAAYGGWSMDDHHPGGLHHPGEPTIFHPAPSPYGIPYRCLYSRNIANLFCAGRNISATHVAMSSTRVMATCAILGQAVGTAAAMAAARGLMPRQVGERAIRELQQALMADDCYLPGLRREVSPLARQARLTADAGDPEPLRNGIDRPVGEEDNGWRGPLGSAIEYRFADVQPLREVRLVFDSDLNRQHKNLPCCYPLAAPSLAPPASLIKSFRLEAETTPGSWQSVYRAECSYQRLVRVPLRIAARAIRFIPEATWGASDAHVFSFEAM